MHASLKIEQVAEPYARYLRVLGFHHVPEGITGLASLVQRHLCRVPFENISKLLLIAREGGGRVPTIDEFLDGVEFQDLGGTCYTSNPFLHQLLVALGYEAQLLGADMQNPNVHTVIRVHIAGTAYHVDVGYAAPLRRPISLNQMPLAIEEGELRYELSRDDDECEMKVSKYGEFVHGYRAHSTSQDYSFFKDTVIDSYLPGKTFMTCLRITRFFNKHSVELKDDVLTFRRGTTESHRRLRSRHELREAINEDFSLPRCPAEDALDVLERITGKRILVH